MKRLLLVGAGQSQLFVLRALARRRRHDLDIVLLTPQDRLIYTGMLPGWVAGHYALDEIDIPLEPLARAAGARLLVDELVGLDAERRVATTAYGRNLEFDVVSLATGGVTDLAPILGAEQHALALRPYEQFVERWSLLQLRLASMSQPTVTVIGAGVGGVEIALAIAFRMRSAGNGSRVQLISGGTFLGDLARPTGELVERTLRLRGIRLIEGPAKSLDALSVQLEDGTAINSDTTLVITGTAPPPWLAASNCQKAEDGFVAVDSRLQSVSHPAVFAAGDIASLPSKLPKSGVYAVRAGPILAANVLAALDGGPLTAFRPQGRALYLISTGRQHAIASWGTLAFHGTWVWRWKDWIDRDFISKFRQP